MAAELTSEEVVTMLLTSKEILNSKQRKNFYVSNHKINTLGDFLHEVPFKKKIPEVESIENLKYRFITK